MTGKDEGATVNIETQLAPRESVEQLEARRNHEIEEALQATTLSKKPTPVDFEGVCKYVKTLTQAYKELFWLADASGVKQTTEKVAEGQGVMISKAVFGTANAEFDKCFLGVLLLLLIKEDNYDSFVKGMFPFIPKISKESWAELRDWTSRLGDQLVSETSIQDKDKDASLLESHGAKDSYQVLILCTIIFDMAKVKGIQEMVRLQSGKDFVVADQKQVVSKALNLKANVFPSLRYGMSRSVVEMLRLGLQTQFNPAQWNQGECPPYALKRVRELAQNPEYGAGNKLDKQLIIDLYFYLSMMDVAAAVPMSAKTKDGKTDLPTGSKIFGEGLYQSNIMMKKALALFFAKKGDQTDTTEREVYLAFLVHKGRELGLSPYIPLEYVLTRVCLLNRYAKPAQAQLCLHAYNLLPLSSKKELKRELLYSGIDDAVAILPYMSPAVFANFDKSIPKDQQKDWAIQNYADILSKANQHAVPKNKLTDKDDENGSKRFTIIKLYVCLRLLGLALQRTRDTINATVPHPDVPPFEDMYTVDLSQLAVHTGTAQKTWEGWFNMNLMLARKSIYEGTIQIVEDEDESN